ncbi:MAG: penicillin-binding transpeptidase domain-containing protein [Micromonosporaceae bacterium]
MRQNLSTRPLRCVTAAIVAVITLAALGACTRTGGAQPVLQAFLAGWSAGTLDKVGFLDANGAPIAAADVATQIKSLGGDLANRPITLAAGRPSERGDDATATVNVAWAATDRVTWRYQTTVRMHRKDGAWRVVWTPSTVQADLKAGDALALRVLPATRAGILDGAGEAIITARPVVVVGVEPRRITDAPKLIADLAAAFAVAGVDVDLADLPARIAAAKPDAFVEVVTLRREIYDGIRARIHDLAGTAFREETRQLAPSRTFARALLGTVGPVLKEQLDAHPGRYQVGDEVGQSGLQEEYDDQLRGTPGVSILVTARAGATEATSGTEHEVFRTEPAAGPPLATTLDQRVQNAADAALAHQPLRAAVVAVRVSDGAILAVANGPNGSDLNLALTARVPPGSTFKMVTALGLLDAAALTLDTPVNCPGTFTVEGRTFTNANNFALGVVPFRVDFAKSCNTAFASLAPKLGPDGLARAAASVGVGVPWQLGTEAFTGSVATNATPVEAAAAAFGQGTTQVSPVALAVAAASVARGTWLPPRLVISAGAGPPSANPVALNPAAVTALRTMMREVVTGGTGVALLDVPGDPVYAKTGTAEYDNVPAHTHAWTIGWRGPVAFAVFVEQGGASTSTAVPIAEAFLRAL